MINPAKPTQAQRLAAKAIFHEIRREVLAEFPDIPHIKFEPCFLAERDHAKEWRTFCHWRHKKGTICYAEEFLTLSEERQRGILAHEWGHVLDDLYEPEAGDPAAGIEDPEVKADVIAAEWLDCPLDYDEEDVQVVRKRCVARMDDDEEE